MELTEMTDTTGSSYFLTLDSISPFDLQEVIYLASSTMMLATFAFRLTKSSNEKNILP